VAAFSWNTLLVNVLKLLLPAYTPPPSSAVFPQRTAWATVRWWLLHA
jgi:hypothetical protein